MLVAHAEQRTQLARTRASSAGRRVSSGQAAASEAAAAPEPAKAAPEPAKPAPAKDVAKAEASKVEQTAKAEVDEVTCRHILKINGSHNKITPLSPSPYN